MKTLMLAPCVYGGFFVAIPIGWVSSAIFVTVALTRLPFLLYHSVLLKRQTALVSTGNGIHILPQTSTICWALHPLG